MNTSLGTDFLTQIMNYGKASSLTPEEFSTGYFNPGKPVIIMNTTKGWLAESSWRSQSELKKRYGDKHHFIGKLSPLSETNLRQSKTMQEFLSYMTSATALNSTFPDMLWEDIHSWVRYHQAHERHPIEDTGVPEIIQGLAKLAGETFKTEVKSAAVSMGPACGGQTVTKKKDVFSALVAGLRYWVLDAKDLATSDVENIAPNDYIARLAKLRGDPWWTPSKTSRLLECTQREGEVLFVPRDRSQLVINLWPSAAVHHEFQLSEFEPAVATAPGDSNAASDAEGEAIADAQATLLV